jgi:hypothetical protein
MQTFTLQVATLDVEALIGTMACEATVLGHLGSLVLSAELDQDCDSHPNNGPRIPFSSIFSLRSPDPESGSNGTQRTILDVISKTADVQSVRQATH